MWLGVNPPRSGTGLLRWPVLPGLAAALVILGVWINNLPPPVPPLPTSDVYTHLSVARHLLAGDGFLTDIAYPLSFAHDFARELPQPLVHRPPGFALLLTGPVLLAGDDPGAAVRHVRWLQLGLVFLTVWAGATAYLRRGNYLSLILWPTLLAANLLFDLAVDWGFSEVAAGLVLLLLWLRSRDRDADPGPVDGLLAGGLALLRPDLVWVPILWWLWVRRTRRDIDRMNAGPADHPAAVSPRVSPLGRNLPRALLVLLLVTSPWLVRNTLLTGNPVFSVQAGAELVKDTRSFPGYDVYRQLEPQPVGRALTDHRGPVARKFARGLRFYLTRSGALIQIPQLAAGVLILLWVLGGAVTRRPPGPGSPLGPIAVAMTTLLLLMAQYALFDHSLRHLLVLLPLLTWELAPVFTDNIPRHFRGGLATTFSAFAPGSCLIPSWVMPLVFVLLITTTRFAILTPDGWPEAMAQAEDLAPQVPARAAAFAAAEPPPLFVDWPAVTWYADRPAVWDPEDEAVRDRIRAWLDHVR